MKIKLLRKEFIAKDTMAFYFEKPAGFTYQAGQYADYALIDPPETDEEGDKRTFSFASAPYEPELMIATRLRDTAFKRVLKDLPEGSELAMDGPYGSFALPKNSETPAVFITGGIGCTFVRSMVTQATHEAAPHKLTFIYANNSPEDAAFLDEFATLAKQNPRFTFVPVMASPVGEWNGETGLIRPELLQKYISDVAAPVYYLSGPGAMLHDMRRMLTELGVNRFNIRLDNYIGY